MTNNFSMAGGYCLAYEDGALVFWLLENSIRISGLISYWATGYGGLWVPGKATHGTVFIVQHTLVRLRRTRFLAAPRRQIRYDLIILCDADCICPHGEAFG